MDKDGKDPHGTASDQEGTLSLGGSDHDGGRAQGHGDDKLKSIRVEAMMSDNTMIYRGTKDLGNAFYADWVIGNLKNIAVWHNEEKK